MNVGQRLVQLSGLPSGSALAHFAAIVQGNGSGQTIFAHRCDISVVETSLSVLRKAKKSVSDDARRDGEIDSRKKAVYVFIGATESVRINCSADEATVVQSHFATTVSQKIMTETIKKVRNGM